MRQEYVYILCTATSGAWSERMEIFPHLRAADLGGEREGATKKIVLKSRHIWDTQKVLGHSRGQLLASHTLVEFSFFQRHTFRTCKRATHRFASTQRSALVMA